MPRSGATGGRRPLLRFPKPRGLMDERAEPRMIDVERVDELAFAHLGMGDAQRARREPPRQRQAEAEYLQEVALAEKFQRAVAHMYGERDADAEPDVFLEAGRAGKALG